MTKYYYYQKAKETDKWLPNMWMCCGGVNEETKEFYLDYFTKHDTRFMSDLEKACKKGYDVVIVEGFRGNVAGRDGKEIEETEIIEKR